MLNHPSDNQNVLHDYHKSNLEYKNDYVFYDKLRPKYDI